MRPLLHRLRSRLTYANVMSTLAVVLVLAGGTAYAATSLITGRQVARETLTSVNVKNGTLGVADLSLVARNALRGARGAAGADGAAGAPGEGGPSGLQGAQGIQGVSGTLGSLDQLNGMACTIDGIAGTLMSYMYVTAAPDQALRSFCVLVDEFETPVADDAAATANDVGGSGGGGPSAVTYDVSLHTPGDVDHVRVKYASNGGGGSCNVTLRLTRYLADDPLLQTAWTNNGVPVTPTVVGLTESFSWSSVATFDIIELRVSVQADDRVPYRLTVEKNNNNCTWLA